MMNGAISSNEQNVEENYSPADRYITPNKKDSSAAAKENTLHILTVPGSLTDRIAQEKSDVSRDRTRIIDKDPSHKKFEPLRKKQ